MPAGINPHHQSPCDKGPAIEMIQEAVTKIFEKLEELSKDMRGMAIQQNDFEHVSRGFSELKNDLKAIEGRIAKEVSKIAGELKPIEQKTASTSSELKLLAKDVETLTRDVNDLKLARDGVQKRMNSFWWLVLRWTSLTIFIIVVEHFPKIAKYFGAVDSAIQK